MGGPPVGGDCSMHQGPKEQVSPERKPALLLDTENYISQHRLQQDGAMPLSSGQRDLGGSDVGCFQAGPPWPDAPGPTALSPGLPFRGKGPSEGL